MWAVNNQPSTMRRLLRCLTVLAVLFVSLEAEYAASVSDLQNPSQYGLVYALDFDNNQQKRNNEVDDDAGRDFRKLPENGLLIIRLLPKSMLKGTVLENVEENNVPNRRFKRSPGGGGCAKCGGGGGGGRPGGGGGGGGSSGAWSTSSSSSGAWGKGGGKG